VTCAHRGEDEEGGGKEDEDEDEEARRQRRRARRAERDHSAVMHRRVFNEGLNTLSPGMPMLRGQSDLNARLPFIHRVRCFLGRRVMDVD
jgi:hypothetical protein